MKSWNYALPILLTTSASAADDAAPAQGLEYLTREQVVTLPPSELAQRVLRGIAPTFVEVSRPSPSDAQSAIERIDFATAPWELEPGLCVATVMSVGLEKPLYGKPYDSQPPVRAKWLSTNAVYKVANLTRREREAWSKKAYAGPPPCSQAGPVLPTKGQIGFFKVEYTDNPNMMSTAYEALHLAVTGGYETDTKLQCNPRSAGLGGTTECSDVPALLRLLSLSDLNKVSFGPCKDQLGVYCIEGQIHRKPTTAQIQFWELRLRVRLRHPGDVPDDVRHIDSIVVNDGWGFYE